MSDDMTGSRVTIKTGWDGAGRSGTVIGKPTYQGGQPWTPVVWDDDEDPDWIKTAAVVPEALSQHHTILVTVTSTLSFLDAMSTLVDVAKAKFGNACATGVDPKKLADETARILDERNAAMAELHKLRCEREAEQANSDQRAAKGHQAEQARKDAKRARMGVAERRLKKREKRRGVP
jgi:hypothetical protein